MSNELSDVQQEIVEQQEAIIEYAKNLEDTIANYQAVNEHFGQHFESIVPALVVPGIPLRPKNCKIASARRRSSSRFPPDNRQYFLPADIRQTENNRPKNICIL